MTEYTAEFLARFWSKIDCTDGLFSCWKWTASGPHGYGQIGWKRRLRYAHRISYELANGPFPDELDVLHKCDNPSCVNPTHLFLGTHLENMQDMASKGRTNPLRAEKNGNGKLTDVEVEEIRRRFDEGSATRRALAEEFHVGPEHISDIVNHKVRRTPTSPEYHPGNTKNYRRKVSDAQVVEIRYRYMHGETNQTALAREYGISNSQVWCIVHMKERVPNNVS